MKARLLRRMLPVGLVGGLVFSVAVVAQNAPDNFMAPMLSSGSAEIMKLSQAKISDDTIIAYIRNGGKSFFLNADQIVYLREAGVSESVITAMLNQPNPSVAPPTTSEPATTPPESTANETQTEPNYNEPYYNANSAPYYYPYSYTYYYPAYGYYNWSYPFYWPYCWGSYYWPYCWGGYWNGYWSRWWHGQPCYWR